MERNDEYQREIVRNQLNKSMVVTAGAGSGKTRELVSRYLNLIQNSQNPSEMPHQILALTFTNKAAAEMKKRIRREYPNEQELENGDRSSDAKIELAFAPVLTFHAFCTMILREFAIEAKVDPEFSILDESEKRKLEEKAFSDLTLHPHDEEETALFHLLVIYGKWQLQEMLYQLAEHREWFHHVSSWIKQDKESMLAQWESTLCPIREHAIDSFFADETAMHALHIIREAGRGLDPSDKAVQHFELIRPATEQITQDTPHERFAHAIDTIVSQSLGNKGAKKIWGEEELFEAKSAYKTLQTRLKELQTYMELVIDPGAAYIDVTFDIIADLCTVAKGYFFRLNREKKKTGSLDFMDLISHTKHFLDKNPHIVAKEIRKRYRYIFIDEFQDTDPAQFEIISSIIGTLDESCKGLFIVGDPNQSIYLFRNADVTQFKWVKEVIAESCKGELLHFSTCFRSTPEVIGCVNYVFSRIFSADKKPWEFLHTPTRVSDTRRAQRGSVQILLAGEVESSDNVKVAKKQEAKLIVHTIKSHLKTTGCKPGDIAILIERRTHLETYLSALEEAGLPFVVGKGMGFYMRQEVLDLYSVLSFICTPHDDCALLGVLRSPYICLSDQCISILALRCKGVCLWDKMRSVADPRKKDKMEPLFGEEYQRLVFAQGQLAEWILIGWTRPLQIAIDSVLRSSQICKLYRALADGEQRIANLRKLIDIILERSTEAGYGIVHAVENIKGSIQAEELEGEAEQTRHDAISVMTVHAAKGLEFPVVILAGLSDRKARDHFPIFIGTKPEEFGIKVPDPDADYEIRETPVYTALHLLHKEKELAERKRLLYVGMTRARDHLILSGIRPKTKYSSIAEGKTKMDFLCTVFDIDPQVLSPPPVQFDVDEAHIVIPIRTDLDEGEDAAYSKEKIKSTLRDIRDPLPEIRQISVSAKKHAYTTQVEQIQINLLVQREDHAVDERRVVSIPGSDHLQPDQIGTLMHEIFSGVPARIVLQRYGIFSKKAIHTCQGYYERFLSLPILKTTYEEYMELPCCLFLRGFGSQSDLRLDGVIDRLCKTDHGWVLIDYKTRGVEPSEFQLVLEAYRRAAERLVQESVMTYLYEIPTHTLFSVKRMEDNEFLSSTTAKLR
ncbi:MAG: UvrD-helicase domain-containing protein [Methanomicrobiales archaeon]|jgi:ATP-dependent helicase/nuclease subunit A|nr:UvrD-helicase domain-containing protein [Methanomicrobiales archaeon]